MAGLRISCWFIASFLSALAALGTALCVAFRCCCCCCCCIRRHNVRSFVTHCPCARLHGYANAFAPNKTDHRSRINHAFSPETVLHSLARASARTVRTLCVYSVRLLACPTRSLRSSAVSECIFHRIPCHSLQFTLQSSLLSPVDRVCVSRCACWLLASAE